MEKQINSRGFTLIASLLLLMLLSGVAIGLLMMVNTEASVGSNDVENSLAYRSAEGAIEQMTSNIATTFQNIQAPQPSDITGLAALKPTIPGITFPSGGYTLTPRTKADGSLAVNYGQVHSGSNAGLYAQILPIDLAVTAERPFGDQVRMLRTVEVALIPVFQFGVFSDSDLSFFSSPTLDFAGRVHTNGDLYLGVSSTADLTFHDKLTAYGNVVRMQLPNGLDVSTGSYNDDGEVWIPTTSYGCDTGKPGCQAMSIAAAAYREGSVKAGPTSAQNPSWATITNNYHGYILDGNYDNAGGTGVKSLTLPFVTGNAQPFEIIRRLPKQGQTATSADSSRLSEQAQIRVLLSDQCTDLHLLDWNGDASQDVALDDSGFIPTVGGNASYFAWANTNNNFKPHGVLVKYDADFVAPYASPGAAQWPLIGGCLLVEVQHTDGKWYGVTKEWLNLGFARGLLPPASSVTPIAVHPNAILMLQMLADRSDNGNVTDANESTTVVGDDARYNWFPINMYDSREGEARDWLTTAEPAANTCAINGVMNAVELDVYNLKRWLAGTIGASGSLVDSTSQNGYILYFSDRRGMLPDPLAVAPEPVPPDVKGEYGFEDVINTASGTTGTPDGIPETSVLIKGLPRSPEDTNGNGRLDKYGAVNVGDGVGAHAAVNVVASSPNPFVRVACLTTARKNRVTGARRALKLVDGASTPALSRLPAKPSAYPNGGFTVASENPVYIQGDYNSSVSDPTWLTPTATEMNHAAAAVIADTVTLLSNQWQDVGVVGAAARIGSLLYPFDANQAPGNRPAVTTYYRVAIASGKTLTFPHPTFANSPTYFGTDGGLHNFLRFLENWNPATGQQSLYYKGSMVSLYYSTYATGTFKCCNYMVYEPPVRNYAFDPLFSDPKNLPPGTPMFRDVNNLSYRQDFTAH